jgi:hypothetical protein
MRAGEGDGGGEIAEMVDLVAPAVRGGGDVQLCLAQDLAGALAREQVHEMRAQHHGRGVFISRGVAETVDHESKRSLFCRKAPQKTFMRGLLQEPM